jgi:hypothetical protein
MPKYRRFCRNTGMARLQIPNSKSMLRLWNVQHGVLVSWGTGLLQVVMEGFNFHSDFRILEQKNARDCSAIPSEWIDTMIASKRAGPGASVRFS